MTVNEFQRQKTAHTQRPSLRKEVWNSLSKEHQVAWDTVSDRGKFSIMFAFKDGKASAETEDRRLVNFTEEDESEEEQENDGVIDLEDPQTSVLINAGKRGTTVPAADIRRMPSTPNKGRRSGAFKPSKDQLRDRDINVNMEYRVSVRKSK